VKLPEMPTRRFFTSIRKRVEKLFSQGEEDAPLLCQGDTKEEVFNKT
jgi:hypothetical protein